MSTLDKIEAFVAQAEAVKQEYPKGAVDPDLTVIQGFLNPARDLLAQAALAGNELDPKRLEALAKRCSKNSGDENTPMRLIAWGNFMGCVVDFLREGVVGMKDGRMATVDGWDYSNCEPDDLHSRISRLQSERLQAYVETLTDAEASPNPDRNPSEYDEKFDETVQEAIALSLNGKGFPQIWQKTA